MKKYLVMFLILTLFCPGAFAQEAAADPAAAPVAPATEAADSLSGGEGAELPRSFRELSLGLSLDDLKAALQKDSLFYFRGDRDVSFLPAREQNLVETSGLSFIRRSFFQLREGAVFIMAFTLDTSLIDYYSVFSSFVKKYGEPSSLDPKEAVWESGNTRVAIERPLTVKYIDVQVFNEIIAESKALESSEFQVRQELLESF